MTKKRWMLAVLAALVLAGGYALTAAPSGPRAMHEFDAERLADLELRMWQAYYAKENVRLFGLLTMMLREQYRYPWSTAVRESVHLARAAATFGNARSNYEQVLPDLEAAYAIARDWLDAEFDPAAVARSELAWWVARRTPGQNSPEQVGELIAAEYALLYAVPREAVRTSALIRAEAAALRDAEAGNPDWQRIGHLLRQSYTELWSGLHR